MKAGRVGAGSDEGIAPYLLPIVSVCQPKVLFIKRFTRVARMITIREPGIFLFIFGHA